MNGPTKISHASIAGSTFEHSDMQNSTFYKLDLRNSSFKNCRLAGSTFHDVSVGNCKFTLTCFEGMKIEGGNFTNFTINGIPVNELLAAYKETHGEQKP